MNLDNRRLREIQLEKKVYEDQLRKARTPHDRQIYTGKIGCLETEEKQILKRNDVVIT